MGKIKFIFRPGKRGIGQVMGDLEKGIMEYLWKHGKAPVKDVYEFLSSEKKIAYTTVITVMNRLLDKNILKREKSGKVYIFEPIVDKDEYKEFISEKVIRGLMEIDGEKAISAFVDKVIEDPEELEYLSRLIEERTRKV